MILRNSFFCVTRVSITTGLPALAAAAIKATQDFNSREHSKFNEDITREIRKKVRISITQIRPPAQQKQTAEIADPKSGAAAGAAAFASSANGRNARAA